MATADLPERISRLEELANNMWWSWHEEARKLLRALDYPLWRMTLHNPVKQLHEASQDTLQAAANDPAFLTLYDSVMSRFDADMLSSNTWFAREYGKLLRGPIAYFSMEFAIHNSLPIYAGGLGALAGDICKEASDIGLPLVAVGFMYPQGYFHQRISADGWQEEVYRQLDFDGAPIGRVLSSTGDNTVAEVQLGNATLRIGVWQVQVGKSNIYLLDTNLEENPVEYRQLSARLYVADREQRLQQEIVLGIGGVRVLRALRINPMVWHANEGHTAFMMLERVRELVANGLSFSEAASRVRATTVFTTHTPVLAGHDTFSPQLLEKFFWGYWKSLGIDRDTFSRLGLQDGDVTQTFNMTAFALRMASQRCAVSRLHGEVARKMWHGIWPNVPEDEVPILHVTNGVHVASWVAPELASLLEKYLGKNWTKEYDSSTLWEGVMDIPDAELWAVHQELKRKFVGAVRERMRSRWVEDNVPWRQVMAMGALLDPEALTIAFVRRFTEYKRPQLVFRDIDRLKRIVNNEFHPVHIVFAGKSHPADSSSKQLLHKVYALAEDRAFQGRIVFVEDYDMHMARYLVQGVDVWLNTPRRLQEACGTSGMKASLNGVLHLSVRDGWWHEGYQGTNGWAINGDLNALEPDQEDEADAEALYRLLQEDIVPLYYARDRGGVPHGWIRMAKEAMRSVVPIYNTRRMLKEYTEKAYRTAAKAGGTGQC
jgi:starch phosphorylase